MLDGVINGASIDLCRVRFGFGTGGADRRARWCSSEQQPDLSPKLTHQVRMAVREVSERVVEWLLEARRSQHLHHSVRVEWCRVDA